MSQGAGRANHPHLDGRGWRHAVRLILVALMAASGLTLASPAMPAAAQSPITSQVRLGSDVVSAGGAVAISVQVHSTIEVTTLVDLEVYDSEWRKVYQTWWTPEPFQAGQSRTYDATWAVPTSLPPGEYVVMVGIFLPDWADLLDWNARGAVLTVLDSSATTTTTTTTPTPPTITIPPTTSTTTTTSTTNPPTTSTSTSTTTTTTIRPTTSTSTTTSTTTTPPTTAPPPPPVGSQFVEDFVSASAIGRFDWQLHASTDGTPGCTDCGRSPIWEVDHAEHDMSCGAPTTHRHIPAQPQLSVDFAVLNPATTPNVYFCAPGDDTSKGHVMTTVNTDGVVILSFSPKQTFNDVSRVCFDINTNDNIGAGKWINVWVIPTDSLAANGGRFDFADEPELDPEQGVPGPDDFHFKYFDGSLVSDGIFWWEWDRRASESATRFTQCVEQTGPNQLTYTRDLPCDGNGDGRMDAGVCETQTRTAAGSLPDGPARVIFQDGSYNPDKHGSVVGGITWHWDNLSIS